MQIETSTKLGYWQSSQLNLMSLHTGCYVESIRAGDILLLRTDWVQCMSGTAKYFSESPVWWLVEKEPSSVGCDFSEEPVVRQPGWIADQFVVHNELLGAGILLVEGLINLANLPPRC